MRQAPLHPIAQSNPHPFCRANRRRTNALARASSQNRRLKTTTCRNRCDKKANDVTEAPKTAHAVIVHTKNPNRENAAVAPMVIFPAADHLLPGMAPHEANCLLFLIFMFIMFCMMFWNSTKDKPMYDIQHLEAFCLVADELSFTKAAARMGYSQSAVSKIIIDLERECGATLFERSRSGVQITAEGQVLLPAAHEVVAAQQSFETRVAEIHNLDSGLIRIGTISSIATHWLPKIIAAFQADYPGIRYELFLGDYEELEGALASGRIDCAFSQLPARYPLNETPLEQDELRAVLPADHELAKLEEIPVEAFADEAFIQLKRDENDEVAEIFAGLEHMPNASFTTWDDYAVMSMVENGLAVSILPSLVLRRVPYRIATRPLAPRAFRTLGFLTRKTSSPSLAVERFREYLDCRNDA